MHYLYELSLFHQGKCSACVNRVADIEVFWVKYMLQIWRKDNHGMIIQWFPSYKHIHLSTYLFSTLFKMIKTC